MYRKEVWTEERIAELKRRWENGDSATMIAKAISNDDLALSRNAIMGKVYRLNLADRECDRKEPKQKPLVRQARVIKSKPKPGASAEIRKLMNRAPPVVETIPAPVPLNVTLLDLKNNDCRWPVSGEKAETLFCGHSIDAGSVYCPYHHRMSKGRGTESERRAVDVLKRVAA